MGRRFETYGAWGNLTGALRTTGRFVMEQANPGIRSCHYAEVLRAKLGSARGALQPVDNDNHGIDTLRAKATPGAELNASLFTSLIRVMPRLIQLHGGDSDDKVDITRRSVRLLDEPLSHPQQRAAAFVLSLGSIKELVTDRFLGEEIATEYTKLLSPD